MAVHVPFPETISMQAFKPAATLPQVAQSFGLHVREFRRQSLVNTAITRSIAFEAATFAIHTSASIVTVVGAKFADDSVVGNETTFLVFLVVLGIN